MHQAASLAYNESSVPTRPRRLRPGSLFVNDDQAQIERRLVTIARRTGDHNELAKLLQAYAPAIGARIRIRRRWRSMLSIEDVMQEAYCDVLNGLHRFDGRQSLRSLLYCQARWNLANAVDKLSSRSRSAAAPASDLLHRRTRLADQKHSPMVESQRRQIAELVRIRFSQLHDPYQAVLRMRLLDGLSRQRVARFLGREPGWVALTEHAAKIALRNALQMVMTND